MSDTATLQQQLLASQAEEQRLRAKMELMRRLSTRQGFFDYYFEQLPSHKYSKACFEAVNAEYQELFGVPKYSDLHSFLSVNRKR